MQMLFSKSVKQKDKPGVVVPDVNTTVILAALDAARDGKDLPDLADLPDDVAQALKALGDDLRHRNTLLLSQAVAQSQQASNAMAATAHITGEVRTARTQADLMMSAVATLNLSVTRVSDTARTVAGAMDTSRSAMRDGAQATRDSAAACERISQAFVDMRQAAERLVETAQQISTFVAAIDGLAQQTNLLALNATIEAARAGEAGRGFSVVATEVKALSTQTRKVTDEIRSHISGLESHVGALLETSDGVGARLNDSRDATRRAIEHIQSLEGMVDHNASSMEMIASLIVEQQDAAQKLETGIGSTRAHVVATEGFADDATTAVAATDSVVKAQFMALEGYEIANYVLYRAKSDHVLWKKRLAAMMAGLEGLRPDELVDHHGCRLGKWYDKVTDEVLRNHPDFVALVGPHEQVHQHGRSVAQYYAAGDTVAARRAFDDMNLASAEVLKRLDRLIAAFS